jgi:hypothetical protein
MYDHAAAVVLHIDPASGDIALAQGQHEFAPFLQRGRSRSEAEVTLFGVQRVDPLNGASVGFRFGLPDGWIVKPSRPFEVEVLRSVSTQRGSQCAATAPKGAGRVLWQSQNY